MEDQSAATGVSEWPDSKLEFFPPYSRKSRYLGDSYVRQFLDSYVNRQSCDLRSIGPHPYFVE